MSNYDDWRSTTPDDDRDAQEESEREHNLEIERKIDALEDGEGS